MKETILDWDATTLADAIQAGVVTSLKATETYIDHLQRVNPDLNALVEDRFEQVRLEAKECDRLLKEGKAKGKWFGVPISVKESFHVKGMRTTGGLIHRRDQVEQSDAVVVQKLKSEGVIVLGKTNTPTLCFCQESVNKLYGRTNNPWDLSRTAGGSSGGEAALIAVGGAAVGIGSDIGGSIRFPAHFNGVIGYKSGKHQVSQEGHFPFVTEPLQQDMLGIGAMAKSVNDVETMNAIIADTPAPPVDLDNYELCFPSFHASIPLGEDTQQLLNNVKSALGKSFSITEEFPFKPQTVALLWQQVMSIDAGKGIADAAFPEKGMSPIPLYLKEVLFEKTSYHRFLTWALIGASLFKPRGKQVNKLVATLEDMNQWSERKLTKQILVLPVYHRGALAHGQLYGELFSIQKTFLRYIPYVALANLLGLPSLTIPIGVDRSNMPIALQLVSRVGNEKALFDLGRILESTFRGYIRCEKWD